MVYTDGITPLLTLPIHPILLPAIIFLFPRMEKVLKGKYFTDVEEIKEKTKESLKGITLQGFQDYLEQWKAGLDRCLISDLFPISKKPLGFQWF